MKKIFEIIDEDIIEELLHTVEYGTLALSRDGMPYSVPVNFVYGDGAVYFHGSHGGRKMSVIRSDPNVSLSIVEEHSMIQSYFSSTEGLACPATQFFRSVIIDGVAEIVEEKAEKIKVLTLLMEKLQPEGNHRPLEEEAYDKVLALTAVVKISIREKRAKFKFGQHLDQARFEMIIDHLNERGNEKDKATIVMMKALYRQDKGEEDAT